MYQHLRIENCLRDHRFRTIRQKIKELEHPYTNNIGCKMFNYKEALQDFNIEEYLKNPLTCVTAPTLLFKK